MTGVDYTESLENLVSNLYIGIMTCLVDYAVKDGTVYLPADSSLAAADCFGDDFEVHYHEMRDFNEVSCLTGNEYSSENGNVEGCAFVCAALSGVSEASNFSTFSIRYARA